MARLGGFLLGAIVLGLLMWALKPSYDNLFDIMNSSVNLTNVESVAWRSMPLVIPAILFVILVLYLSGRIGKRRGEE